MRAFKVEFLKNIREKVYFYLSYRWFFSNWLVFGQVFVWYICWTVILRHIFSRAFNMTSSYFLWLASCDWESNTADRNIRSKNGLKTLFCCETVLSLWQKRIHKIFNKGAVSETKALLKQGHAQGFFKNISHDLAALCLYKIYHWLLAGKAKFFCILWKVFWKIGVLLTICSVKYIVSLFHRRMESPNFRNMPLKEIIFREDWTCNSFTGTR